MCGICGVFRFDGQVVEQKVLKEMCDRMVHRGPDGEGYFTSGPFGMGMRRLAIIDIQGGQQPIANEDGRYWVILNGEIYNYVELRAELEARGHIFRTRSDTEVIVHLFEEQGPRAVHDLNGMFAFAVWDDLEKQLFVFRDRIGIKPLFYFMHSLFFAFASDLSALTRILPSVSINHDSFLSYLGLGYVPYPESILESVYKLEPGSFLEVCCGKVAVELYWDIDQVGTLRLSGPDEAREILLPLFTDAIRLQMRSDVPVGVFLSGGIDSSAVLALATQGGAGLMESFSVGFEGGHNELEYAKSTSREYGTQHHEILLRSCDVSSILQELIEFMDEPITDNSIVPSYTVAKIAAENGVPVVLTGAGGDELFGGYHRYFPRAYWDQLLRRLPAPVQSILGKIYQCLDEDLGYRIADARLDYLIAISGSSLSLLRRSLRDERDFKRILAELLSHFGRFSKRKVQGNSRSLMLLDFKTYLVDDILALTDKMTMAVSVEARVPFLDHRFVETCFSVPEDDLFFIHELKWLEKHIFSTILPRALLGLPKSGFSGPAVHWIDDPELQTLIRRNLLDNPNSFYREHLLCDIIRHALSAPRRTLYTSLTIWHLLVFDLWYRRHVERT